MSDHTKIRRMTANQELEEIINETMEEPLIKNTSGFPPRQIWQEKTKDINNSGAYTYTYKETEYISLAEHEHIVQDLRAKLKVTEEKFNAITECRKVLDARGLAYEALRKIRGESGVGGE